MTVRRTAIEDLRKKKDLREICYSRRDHRAETRTRCLLPGSSFNGTRWTFLEKYHYRWRNMVFRLRSGHQTTECGVDGAKLSKTKETTISKIASEDDVNCFFDAEGVIHREFVPEGQKVNVEFYVGVLDRLLKRIRRVRKAKFQSSESFLLHDNATSHNAVIVKKFLANRKDAVLHHPPYSPDLAPADYFLFPKLKFV